jgi:uncharacterized membrane protein
MDFSEGDSRIIFWICSLIVISVFAMIYMLPFALLVWLISNLFDLKDDYREILAKIGVLLSLIFAIGTQVYLWKLYKNKRR